MDNEIVIITGHTGGIGAEIAKQIAQKGYEVLGIDQISGTEDYLEIVADLSDITDEANSSFERDLKVLLKHRKVRAVINCAAIQIVKPVNEIKMSEMQRSLTVNTLAPLRLVQLTLNELEATDGIVINIGSIHSRLTKKNFLAYSVSKAALTGLTRAMSVELGKRIRVVEIQPAAISTPMLEAGFSNNAEQRKLLDDFHPTGKIGQPGEVAELCLLLVENKIPFLNGSILQLDGGISHVLSDPAF